MEMFNGNAYFISVASPTCRTESGWCKASDVSKVTFQPSAVAAAPEDLACVFIPSNGSLCPDFDLVR